MNSLTSYNSESLLSPQMTAFHHAAARGHIEVLEAFYDYGKISIHLRVRPLFNTPLHDAAGCNQVKE